MGLITPQEILQDWLIGLTETEPPTREYALDRAKLSEKVGEPLIVRAGPLSDCCLSLGPFSPTVLPSQVSVGEDEPTLTDT